MATVSLELLKKHVRADEFADDDALLASYLDAAEEAVVRETHRDLDRLLEMGGGQLPLPLRQAVLLIAGHWYNQREDVAAVSMQAIPMGSRYLVAQYRKLV